MRPQDKLKALPKHVIAALCSIQAFRSLKAISRLGKMLSPILAFELNWHLTAHVRMKALRRWAIKPQEVPTVLFRSNEEWTSSDYGWGAICGRISVVAIEGSHLSLFDSPNREALCAKFLETLEMTSLPAR